MSSSASAFSLAFLPSDILSEIVDSLNGDSSIGTLLLSGCKLLWRKLVDEGAVKKLALSSENSVVYGWPSLVSELPRLAEFSIEVPQNCLSVDQWHYDLLTLPRNLKSLKLRAPRVLESLTAAINADSSHFDALETLHLSLPEGYQRTNDAIEPFDASTLPKNLRHLILNLPQAIGWGRRNPRKMVTLSQLPHSLVSFELNGSHMASLGIGELPPTLTSFKTDLSLSDGHHYLIMMSSLHPDPATGYIGLKEVQIRTIISDPTSVLRLLQSIPRSVEMLDIHFIYHIILGNTHLEALPPGLTNLRMDNFKLQSQSKVELLPRSLVHVSDYVASVCGRGDLYKYLPLLKPSGSAKVKFLASMSTPPRSIFADFSDMVTLQATPELIPSTLEDLHIMTMPLSLARACLPRLTYLMSLEVSDFEKNTLHEALEHLPASLSSLSLSGDASLIPNFSKLPRRLQRLSIWFNNPDHVHTLEEEMSSLALPRSLESLSISSSATAKANISPAWFAGLPEHLQSFDLSLLLSPKHVEALRDRCKRLKSLVLNPSAKPKDEVALEKTMKSLPPTLLSLTLIMPSQPGVLLPLSTASLLPPRLRKLDFEGCYIAKSSYIHLPCTLKTVMRNNSPLDAFKPYLALQ